VRGSRSPSLLLIAAVALGLTACGGGDDPSSADGQRLTKAELALMTKQHRESVAVLEDPPESAAEIRAYAATAKRQCGELRASGAVLRATAPACDGSVTALETMVRFGEASDACGDDDAACVERALTGLVTSFDRLTRSFGDVRKAVAGVEAGAACREVLQGSEGLHESMDELRDQARELASALRAVTRAKDEETAATAATAYESAAKRFEAAAAALEQEGGADDLDPAPCAPDVAD
jgi:methyl-accepting chemotaxis protein